MAVDVLGLFVYVWNFEVGAVGYDDGVLVLVGRGGGICFVVVAACGEYEGCCADDEDGFCEFHSLC